MVNCWSAFREPEWRCLGDGVRDVGPATRADGPPDLPGRLARRARRGRYLPGGVPDPGPPGRLAVGAGLHRPLAASGRPPRKGGPVWAGGRRAVGPPNAERFSRSRGGSGEAGEDDLAAIIHEEVDRLPEHYRVPVVLCDLEGRTHEDAARHLGCPVGTVKSRLARGRERLRDQLTRRGLAPGLAIAGPLRAALPGRDFCRGHDRALAPSLSSAGIWFGPDHDFPDRRGCHEIDVPGPIEDHPDESHFRRHDRDRDISGSDPAPRPAGARGKGTTCPAGRRSSEGGRARRAQDRVRLASPGAV